MLIRIIVRDRFPEEMTQLTNNIPVVDDMMQTNRPWRQCGRTGLRTGSGYFGIFHRASDFLISS